MMKSIKLPIRRVLNLSLWLIVCFLSGTGALLYWRMPHGPAGRNLSVFGLSKHDLIELHAIFGLIFVGLIIAHLWLAWPWLKNAAAKKKLWPIFSGIIAGLAIAGGIALAPLETNASGANESSEQSDCQADAGAGHNNRNGNRNGLGPMRWQETLE